MARTRVLRVAEAIQREVGAILDREVDDPGLNLVTVTRVDLSDDLRHAKLFVSFVGGEERKTDGLRRLRRAVRFVRGQLAGRLRLRTVPHLTFVLDDSSEEYLRIDEVLKRIHEEDDGQERNES